MTSTSLTIPEPAIRVALDPANPGQFYACCGLHELADRLWRGAEAWFSRDCRWFCLAPLDNNQAATPEALMSALARCTLTNTMNASDVERLEYLSSLKKKDLGANEEEKKALESQRREEPLVLGKPFHLRLDWWLDDRSGGSRFKTWAGQQSVIDIAQAMKQPIETGMWNTLPPDSWLCRGAGEGVPFNFDSDLGPQSAALDVGFSLDPLKISVPVRPLIEFAALVGLQRFRPRSMPGKNQHQYALWHQPLLTPAACVAASRAALACGCSAFEFPLLYRTKYLKSFLPSQPLRGDR